MSTAQVDPPPARTSFRKPRSSAGFVDGAWWPFSHDLAAELPALIDSAADLGLDIRRIAYNRAWWDPAPRRIRVRNVFVRLGGFDSQDPLMLGLVDEGRAFREDLLVIPPDTDPMVAEEALRIAGQSGRNERPAELMATASGRIGGRPRAVAAT